MRIAVMLATLAFPTRDMHYVETPAATVKLKD
jgi:hypothetical protein